MKTLKQLLRETLGKEWKKDYEEFGVSPLITEEQMIKTIKEWLTQKRQQQNVNDDCFDSTLDFIDELIKELEE